MSGIRTVSSFNPGAAETEGGRTEADKRVKAAGAFGVWKKFVGEVSSPAEAAADEDEREIDGLPFSRTGN